jgi:hypothetical protein
MRVIPAPGVLVPWPDGQARHLPPEGAEVPDGAYWQRRIADGAVTLAPVPPARAAKEK